MTIFSLFGNGTDERDPQAIARSIVGSYQQRRANGELRADDRLFLDLKNALRQNAEKVFEEFRRRRSDRFPKAEFLLEMDIVLAISEAEHYARTFKPIMGKGESASPETKDFDEDDYLFGPLLN